MVLDQASIGGVAQRVFSRYDYDGAYADVLLSTIESVHSATTLTRGDLTRFIERGIETGSTHEIHASAGVNSVTVQTIHAAKGLEHPIVILANMNNYRFPPSGGSGGIVSFDESVGLRQKKRFGEEHGHPHVYDNWRSDVLRKCLPRNYDEERRLLYVAMTRAESHLVFSTGEDPNTFIEKLPVELEMQDPSIEEHDLQRTTQAHLQIAVPTPEGPVGHTPHTLMDDEVFEDVEDGRGADYGTRVHEFAERYALGEGVEPANEDERNVQEFLDSLDGELLVEENAYLPLSMDGEQVTISGIVDLVHVCDDTIEIIDFKTDLSRHAEDEYQKQLSIYYHVLREGFPDGDVTASIYYTTNGMCVEIDPLSKTRLVEITKAVMQG